MPFIGRIKICYYSIDMKIQLLERRKRMKKKKLLCILLSFVLISSVTGVTGCNSQKASGDKTVIELIQYKPEAMKIFEQFEKEFNETHDDIELVIDSPNDGMTVMKTRFIRDDYPDIIGIGGEVNYSNFVDAGILADISDYEGLKTIKPAYVDILENLEFVPTEGTFGVPYVANAAGVLYNKEMFEEHGWQIPETWTEFLQLCDTIEGEGIQPLYFGFKDVWTCLAPWNALAVDLADADVCQQVNRGETTFSKEYKEVAEKMLELLPYGQKGPFAYGYNDACTAFANGESAMYTIGSYAIPQIKSVNPDMKIDSFVMPGSDNKEDNLLNSGVDLQFCVTEDCENKEAAYEVLDFLLEHDNIQTYIDDQNAVPCKDEIFSLAPEIEGMRSYIEQGKMTDYQDHYYPTEMSVDAQIQTLLLQKDTDAFLKKFDKDWLRYNRDIIQKVKDYEETH